MKLIMISLLAAFSLFPFQPNVAIAGASKSLADLSPADQQAYRKLLRGSLQFYNERLRDPASGQYLDARALGAGAPPDYTSSVAATGMGLITLALGDATGEIEQAPEKVLRTLRVALGVNGDGYISKRSKAGWFRHWFDIREGRDNDMSRADGYSTIDTTILVAGAQLAANYFSAAGKDAGGEIRRLADQLLLSVNWDSAVADLDKGRLLMNYELATERPRSITRVYNEYILLACMGRTADTKQGREGLMSQFWKKHFSSPAGLPQKMYEGWPLLTDNPENFLPSFVIQFSTYLCADVNSDPEYLAYFANAAAADRLWFSKNSPKKHLWGLGAGEVRYQTAPGAPVHSGYGVDAIDKNPHVVASPTIMAGFIPADPAALGDLLTLQRNQECTYHDGDREFLWRCSHLDLGLPFDRVQAVDFSTLVLGLATVHPAVNGWEFFRKYAPGAKR